MTFEPEKLATFLEIFEQSKNKIRAMKGCTFLELWQDLDTPNVCITHSHWESSEDLNQYRDSELFKTTWAKTKVLFAAKPLAFSTHVISQTH